MVAAFLDDFASGLDAFDFTLALTLGFDLVRVAGPADFVADVTLAVFFLLAFFLVALDLGFLPGLPKAESQPLEYASLVPTLKIVIDLFDLVETETAPRLVFTSRRGCSCIVTC